MASRVSLRLAVLVGLSTVGTVALGQVQSRDQQICINAINKSAAKLGAQQGRENLACLRDAAGGKLEMLTAEQCLTADRKGKIAKGVARMQDAETAKCSAAPSFAFTGTATASDSALTGRLLSFTDIFTATVDATVIACDDDSDGCKCQKAGAGGADKLMKLKSDMFVKCKKALLAEGAASAADLARCIDDPATEGSIAADSQNKIQKAVDKLAEKIGKTCDEPGVTADAFDSHATCAGLAGAALASCIDRATSCRTCQSLNAIDDLAVDCDLFDNGAGDSSCAALGFCFPVGSDCDDGDACTVNDSCSAVGCTGAQLVAGSAAAITAQMTSIDVDDQVHLLVEIVTVTNKPFELSAIDVDHKSGLALESLGSVCATHPGNPARNRCEHTMSFLATSACTGTGNYQLHLTHECAPTVEGCSRCTDPRTIDFALATGNCCDVNTVLSCGNSQIDFGEACDSGNLNGQTCLSRGYTGGTLACDGACEFDTSACLAPRAFLTSTTYDGNLGGLSGADANCQTHAANAGLGGSWKAWLSSSAIDARERIPAMRYRTMNGTVITVDGSNLYGGGLSAVIDRNEFNGPVVGTAWTGTNTDGTRSTDVCSDWAATAANGTIGNSASTAEWTNNAAPAACSGSQRLYCFEQPAYKRVFLTSSTYTGALGGLAGADAKCQARANATGLGGTWRAWLSTAAVNAKDRIPDAEYRAIDLSTVIASSKADLTDGTIDNHINMDDLGVLRSSFVWTGTDNDGTGTGGNCNGWQSLAMNIPLGRNEALDEWSNASTIGACGNTLRLYCFEE